MGYRYWEVEILDVRVVGFCHRKSTGTVLALDPAGVAFNSHATLPECYEGLRNCLQSCGSQPLLFIVAVDRMPQRTMQGLR